MGVSVLLCDAKEFIYVVIKLISALTKSRQFTTGKAYQLHRQLDNACLVEGRKNVLEPGAAPECCFSPLGRGAIRRNALDYLQSRRTVVAQPIEAWLTLVRDCSGLGDTDR